MAQIAFPFDGVKATESRWERMARVFAAPCVIGTSANNALGLTVAGLQLTVGRGLLGSAEAWVRSWFYVLDAADWVHNVPPNVHATQSRVDRIVLRYDPSALLAADKVKLVHLQGTPAASPVAPSLVQSDVGGYDLPLWRFTVPPNSASPVTGLIDDRRFYDTESVGGTGLIAGATDVNAQNAGTAGVWQPLTTWNKLVALTLIPGRVYEVEATPLIMQQNAAAASNDFRCHGIAGAAVPVVSGGNPTGIQVARAFVNPSQVGNFPFPFSNIFTVAAAGLYSFGFFYQSSNNTNVMNTSSTSYFLRDIGPSTGLSTPRVIS